MANRDLQLIESVKEYIKERVPEFLKEVNIPEERKVHHPLDDMIVEKLDVVEIR